MHKIKKIFLIIFIFVLVFSFFSSSNNSYGTLKWSFKTNGEIFSSPAIGSDETIYVGSDDENLYAINSDGTLKWMFKTDGSITSSPAIGNDGTIYVGSLDGHIYAIGSSSKGLVNSPWPKFHKDNKNTGNFNAK
ncbi:MAG TPA: PQQ-binding-like beta-propeller repeat protein [Exilispira sp.]|nr:PQQ-binding-like beta-propeller repeat protein [Exilispira sp.]